MNQQAASGQRGGQKGGILLEQMVKNPRWRTFWIIYPEKNHSQCLQGSCLKHETDDWNTFSTLVTNIAMICPRFFLAYKCH